MTASGEEPIQLSFEEARVLGCLLEKAATTPDVYPLTLNSLLAACNQRSNREPVVDYSEDEVLRAIEGLRAKKLAFRQDGAGSRVPKFRHNVDEYFGLPKSGKALLTVLLLRGAQTPGQLRARTERMHLFADGAAAEAELDALADEMEPAIWERLAPAPGQKESRYRHLLCGPLPAERPAPAAGHEASVPAAEAPAPGGESPLEERIAALEEELAALRAAFEAFREQFD